MSQQIESDTLARETWESQCLDAMVRRQRNVDRDDAKAFIHAAWSIDRFRTMAPILAAQELLENPAVRPGDAAKESAKKKPPR